MCDELRAGREGSRCVGCGARPVCDARVTENFRMDACVQAHWWGPDLCGMGDTRGVRNDLCEEDGSVCLRTATASIAVGRKESATNGSVGGRESAGGEWEPWWIAEGHGGP